MKRILLMVFRNILIVPFMWIKLCYMAARPDKFSEEQHKRCSGSLQREQIKVEM